MGQPWIAPDTPAEPRRAAPAPDVRRDADPPRPTGPLRDSPLQRLRPRSVLAVIDAGFEVLRFRFPLIAALTATVVIPLAGFPLALRNLGLTDALDDYSKVSADLGLGAGANSDLALGILGAVGNSLALAVLGVAVAHLVGSWLMGGDPTYGETLRVVLRRGPVVALAWFVVLPLKALGLALCFVGVLLTVAWFVVLAPVVAIEGLGPLRSVARTYRLSAGKRTVAMCGFVLTAVVVNGVCSLLLEGIGGLLADQVLRDSSWSWAVASLMSLLVSLVLMPVQAAWAAMAYIDLRVRAEGLDIVLDADRILGPEAARVG